MRMWDGKHVLVIGLGVSGLAAARLLVKCGAQVTVSDDRPASNFVSVSDELKGLGVRLSFGELPESLLLAVDAIVVSPGVPDSRRLAAAVARGVEVLNEVELAAPFLNGTLIGITGTNGKSTVTSWIGAMCRASGRPTFVGGNLGTPLCEAAGTSAAQPGGYVVAELSSFQLERVTTLRPHVAVLLNITPDHLDRYPNFEAYAAAKGRIFSAQTAEDAAVVPGGDALCESLAAAGRATVHRFDGWEGLEPRLPSSAPAKVAISLEVTCQDGQIIDSVTGMTVAASALRLRGAHNVANACAAVLAARLAGVDVVAIRDGLLSFGGLPHRMEYVGEHQGVAFFDDSKATNVAAAVTAVQGVDECYGGIVLVAGGQPKGDSYAPLRDAMQARGRGLVLLGQAAEAIAEAFASTNLPVVRVVSIEEAAVAASRLAQRGDAVLLAPACASWDMFRSYVERGERFQGAVSRLGEPGKDTYA